MTVLDCEKEAVLGVHDAIEEGESAVDYGVASFKSSGTSTTFPPSDSYVTTDRDSEDGDVFNAIDDFVDGGATNFAQGLEAAKMSIGASDAPGNKYIIFLSDGVSNQGAGQFDAAVEFFKDAGVKIFSFAVGASVSCTSGNDGTLQYMADETGGKCEEVQNAADLGAFLLDLVSTEMTSDGLTVDGDDVTPTTHTNSPPFSGPASDELHANGAAQNNHILPGAHMACISASGLGPASDSASEETAGCCVEYHVVSFDLDPLTATNDLSAEHSHTVTAEVSGDIVEGWEVKFSVGGKNAGAIGGCDPPSCETNDEGKVSFTYEVPIEPDSLGTDTIDAELVVSDTQRETITVKKKWIDATPPMAYCVEGPNPSGKIPKAPGKGGQGMNQDGFYTLSAVDEVYPPEDLKIYVKDNGSSTIFGPFASGTNIKWTEANGAKPKQKNGSGEVDYRLNGKGDALVYAVDPSGNEGVSMECLVPPDPK